MLLLGWQQAFLSPNTESWTYDTHVIQYGEPTDMACEMWTLFYNWYGDKDVRNRYELHGFQEAFDKIMEIQ